MQLSLQTKITLQSILATLIVAITLGWLAFTKFNESNHNSINSESQSQASAISIYLANWYEDREATMQTVRLHLEATLSETGENEAAILAILQQAQSSLHFGMTFLGLENGHMYRHDPSLNSADYDPRVRSWYKNAKASQQDYVTAPYISASTQKLSMTFVEPIYVNGEFVGAIGGLVFLDDLLDRILELDVLGNGEIILLDEAGSLLAHQDTSLIQKNISDLDYGLSSDLIDEALAAQEFQDIRVVLPAATRSANASREQ